MAHRHWSSLSKRISLKFLLLLPLAVQVATVGLIGYLSFKNEQKSTSNLVEQLMDKADEQVIQNLNSYLTGPKQLLQVSQNLVEQGSLDLNNFEASGFYLWKQVQTFDNINYFGYGLTTGEFAGAGSFLEGQGITIDEISPATNGNNHTFGTNSQGQRTEVLKVYTPEDWNPLADPWYTETVKQGKPTAASVFVWPEDPDIISLPIAYPLYNSQQEFQGVIYTEFYLSNISDFLRSIDLSPSAEIYIIERDGNLVANSVDQYPFEMVDGIAQRLNVIDSANTLIQNTATSLTDQFNTFQAIETPQSLKVKSDGKAHFLHVTPWQDEVLGIDWLVVIAVPESDFMAQIYAQTRNTIAICLAAFGLATVFGTPLVRAES